MEEFQQDVTSNVIKVSRHVVQVAGILAGHGGVAVDAAAPLERGSEADPGGHHGAADLAGVRRGRPGGEPVPAAANLPHHRQQDRQAVHHLPGEQF